MRSEGWIGPLALLGAALVAILSVSRVAASLALQQPGEALLAVELASRLKADYSRAAEADADPRADRQSLAVAGSDLNADAVAGSDLDTDAVAGSDLDADAVAGSDLDADAVADAADPPEADKIGRASCRERGE